MGQAALRLVGALCSAGWAGVSGWAALSAVALDDGAARMLGGVGDLARLGEAMAGLRLVALVGGGRASRSAGVRLEVELLLLAHLEGFVALRLADGGEHEVAVLASIRGGGTAERLLDVRRAGDGEDAIGLGVMATTPAVDVRYFFDESPWYHGTMSGPSVSPAPPAADYVLGRLTGTTDWRTTRDATRSADPMRTNAARMLPSPPSDRAVDFVYQYDWLSPSSAPEHVAPLAAHVHALPSPLLAMALP